MSPSSVKSRLAWSVLIILTGNRSGTSCSTTVNRMIPLHQAKPTGTHTISMGCATPPMPLADSGFSWLHSTWRPCSANNLHHLSSCCFPTSPSWAPVSHRTSPGSRVTNVHEAPRKKGLRSVGFATVMDPFFVFPKSHCTSIVPFVVALSSIPFGTLASPMSQFATSCTPRAQFQLLNARALHAWSLISATCTSPGAKETSGILRSIEILSDSLVPRMSESWSSLQ